MEGAILKIILSAIVCFAAFLWVGYFKLREVQRHYRQYVKDGCLRFETQQDPKDKDHEGVDPKDNDDQKDTSEMEKCEQLMEDIKCSNNAQKFDQLSLLDKFECSAFKIVADFMEPDDIPYEFT